MPNILEMIMGVAPAAAQPAPARRTYSAALEQKARASGFRSAEEMMLWAKQRNTPTGGTISGQSRPSVRAATDAHPANIFARILGAYNNATGQD